MVGIVAISDVVQRVPDEVIAGPRLLPGDVLTLLARPAHPDVLRSLHGDAVG